MRLFSTSWNSFFFFFFLADCGICPSIIIRKLLCVTALKNSGDFMAHIVLTLLLFINKTLLAFFFFALPNKSFQSEEEGETKQHLLSKLVDCRFRLERLKVRSASCFIYCYNRKAFSLWFFLITFCYNFLETLILRNLTSLGRCYIFGRTRIMNL